jgi:hypothetical protein
VAFIVPVAGPAVGTGEQEIYRVINWLRKEGFTSDEVTAAEEHMRLFFAVVDEKASWDSLEASTKRARNSRWASFVQLPSSLTDLTWWKRMRVLIRHATAGLTCASLHLSDHWMMTSQPNRACGFWLPAGEGAPNCEGVQWGRPFHVGGAQRGRQRVDARAVTGVSGNDGGLGAQDHTTMTSPVKPSSAGSED